MWYGSSCRFPGIRPLLSRARKTKQTWTKVIEQLHVTLKASLTRKRLLSISLFCWPYDGLQETWHTDYQRLFNSPSDMNRCGSNPRQGHSWTAPSCARRSVGGRVEPCSISTHPVKGCLSNDNLNPAHCPTSSFVMDVKFNDYMINSCSFVPRSSSKACGARYAARVALQY